MNLFHLIYINIVLLYKYTNTGYIITSVNHNYDEKMSNVAQTRTSSSISKLLFQTIVVDKHYLYTISNFYYCDINAWKYLVHNVDSILWF